MSRRQHLIHLGAWAVLSALVGSAFVINAIRLLHTDFPLFLLWLFATAVAAVAVALTSAALAPTPADRPNPQTTQKD
ncbi:MAG: hypothetical protein AAF318_16765 [Pseudomonadota bacterium]